MYVSGLVKNQKSNIFPVLFSGTPVKIFKILGFKILSFNRAIELHYHLDIFFKYYDPRLQNAKFENVGMSKFLSAFDLLGYWISSESVKSLRVSIFWGTQKSYFVKNFKMFNIHVLPYFQGLSMWQSLFHVWSHFRNQKFSRSFFQVRRGNFWKILVSIFLALIGLSICIVISKSFSHAFFRDSRMHNLKMLGCQNFCLSSIYLDIEFHQNRLNPYGSKFF